uniref:Pro-interleukin-16 n=2 Tax=Mesocestoides corti TaxID=53468 RepID=A0A5K3EQC5_MESCO
MKPRKSAEQALKEVVAYRNSLDNQKNKDLVVALDRVVDVMQSHLYHAYLDVSDFYKTTLLSDIIPPKVKAEMALDIAGRWEQIDSSSTALSASITHPYQPGNDLTRCSRSRSLSQITRAGALGSGANRSNAKDPTSTLVNSCGRLVLGRYRRTSLTRNCVPIFDDFEETSQSASFGSASASNSSFSRKQGNCPVTFRVKLTRGSHGFGFSIAGGTDREAPLAAMHPRFVYVARITPGGVADLDGRLRVYDILLAVNGTRLVGLPHLKAVAIFEQSGPQLVLDIQRPSTVFSHEFSRPIPSLSSPPISTTATRRFHSVRSGDEVRDAQTAPTACKSRLAAFSLSHCPLLPTTSNSSSESSGALPTTVSPLSSLFTSCQNPSGETAGRKRTSTAVATAVNDQVAEETKESQATGSEKEDKDDTIWLFDPDKTMNRRSFSLTNETPNCGEPEAFSESNSNSLIAESSTAPQPAIKSHHERTSNVNKATSVSTRGISDRPLPNPSPGPVIVEVPLIRGTRAGFGFRIAGGIGTEFMEGDSGVFITQVTPGGVADSSGRVAVGDRLLRVNSVSLVNVTHEEAVETLQNAGDFALLLLVKASLQSSQRLNCRQCQETVQNLQALPNTPGSGEEQTPIVQPSQTSARSAACRRPSRQQRSRKRKPTRHHPQTSSLGPSNMRVEAVPVSTITSGPDDYAAACAVPESVLLRWPKARLVTLYKECPTSDYGSGASSVGNGGSLGFNIVGGDGADGIYVSHIHADSPAARSKAISVGDRLLVVNGTEVVGSNHEEAAILLKMAPTRVDLILAYVPDEYKKFEDQIRQQTDNSDIPSDNREGEGSEGQGMAKIRHSIEADGLFVRVLVDFDPRTVTGPNQVVPRSAISIRSGDILQLLNISDREWWQARTIHPSTCKPLGPTGLVPSRGRLERQEQAKWELRFGRGTRSFDSSIETGSSIISDPQSTDKAIKSINLSQSDAPSFSSKHSPLISIKKGTTNWHPSTAPSKSMKKRTNTRARSESVKGPRLLTYIPVTSVRTINTRPVVILGDLMYSITEDLLADFPRDFSTCVPHTTRHRRHGEVDGRDYHFVKSRSKMESEINLNRYIEAGEYNGNLYGTHIQSVFKVASSGFHCLLDVGGLAMQRLTAAGLPPIAIFVLSHLSNQTVRVLNPASEDSKRTEICSHVRSRSREKELEFLRDYSFLLTAILTVDDYDKGLERIREIIQDNKGPQVWISSSEHLP